MSLPLVTEELWEEVSDLLPKKFPSPKGGRPRVPDRNCLAGIVFVLKTGIPWDALPAQFGCGSGPTCWRRLEEWTVLGVWPELHRRLLNHLAKLGQIDWSRAIIDSASVRAVFGGSTQGPTQRIEPKLAANAI